MPYTLTHETERRAADRVADHKLTAPSQSYSHHTATGARNQGNASKISSTNRTQNNARALSLADLQIQDPTSSWIDFVEHAIRIVNEYFAALREESLHLSSAEIPLPPPLPSAGTELIEKLARPNSYFFHNCHKSDVSPSGVTGLRSEEFWAKYGNCAADRFWLDVLKKLPYCRWPDIPAGNAPRFATELFEEVQRHPRFKNHSQAAKRRACNKFCNGARDVFRLPNHGVIAFSVGRHRKTTDQNRKRVMAMSAAEFQVAQILEELGYVRLVITKSGKSAHASRAIPLAKLLQRLSVDDAPPRDGPRNRMNTRKKTIKEDRGGKLIKVVKPAIAKEFDGDHPIAIYGELVLQLWLTVAKQSVITYEPIADKYGELPGLTTMGEQLSSWPDLHRLFSEIYLWHGRLYDGKYGIQGILKAQRKTVRINGNATVEPDFCAMHVSMAYNLLGHECPNGVYPPKGDVRANAKRRAYKLMLNIMLNANSRGAAIAAFDSKLLRTTRNTRTGEVREKTENALAEALELEMGLDELRVNSRRLYDLIVKRNPLIAHCFGADMGIRLMNYDSRIALDVILHFALKGVLVLPIHDSFRIDAQYEAEMLEELKGAYRRHINGFTPRLG